MILGFTGTRNGMTNAQVEALARWLSFEGAGAKEVHHGLCIGADEEFAVEADHQAAKRGDPPPLEVRHPSNFHGLRSWRPRRAPDVEHEPKPPLDRNRDIVDACDVLLACPLGMAEVQRSGTWSTVRYARKCRKPIVIFWPDGSITQEQP